MSQYHYSIDLLNADIGWTNADKLFKERVGEHIPAPNNNLDQQKNYLTADRFEFTEYVIINQVSAKVYVNTELNVGAKVVVPAKAKVKLELKFHKEDSQIVLLDKPIVYVAKLDWWKHFKKEMETKCFQDRNCKQHMSYIIESIIFARSATIIKNFAKGLSLANDLDLDVTIPEGIFDISTILSFAFGNDETKYDCIKITSNKPGVVAFRCAEIQWRTPLLSNPPTVKRITIAKGQKLEEISQKQEEEIEGFAPISYGGDCIGFEDRIIFSQMIQ